MAGTVVSNSVQLGDSTTPSQNLVIRTNINGTFTLARGNVGATTQDILTIDANGRIATPQSVVAFSAYQSTMQSLATTTTTKLQLQSTEYDTTGAFDVVNSRFKPLVPGYYSVGGGFSITTTGTWLDLWLYKNGVVFKKIGRIDNTGSVYGAVQVYLNGTDYLELFVDQHAAAQNTVNGVTETYFYGALLAKA